MCPGRPRSVTLADASHAGSHPKLVTPTTRPAAVMTACVTSPGRVGSRSYRHGSDVRPDRERRRLGLGDAGARRRSSGPRPAADHGLPGLLPYGASRPGGGCAISGGSWPASWKDERPDNGPLTEQVLAGLITSQGPSHPDHRRRPRSRGRRRERRSPHPTWGGVKHPPPSHPSQFPSHSARFTVVQRGPRFRLATRASRP